MQSITHLTKSSKSGTICRYCKSFHSGRTTDTAPAGSLMGLSWSWPTGPAQLFLVAAAVSTAAVIQAGKGALTLRAAAVDHEGKLLKQLVQTFSGCPLYCDQHVVFSPPAFEVGCAWHHPAKYCIPLAPNLGM